ncbi:hypothetical protein GCM10025883_36360 [Mobilicoccus caccae]|uniref:Uncharacterized protein n=1 Tax=Mobilicoccus caccae TaxID=1859295 RepID=A0ABQ6IVE5_9MICO|nr:hypothetical protein GCM10025883_36360 [Mobilicoccus caccae]
MGTGFDVTRRAVLFGSLGGVLAACSSPGGSGGQGGEKGAPVDRSPSPQEHGGLRCLARQDSTTLRLHTTAGDVTFWAGVNLGSTTPGHSPGELAVTREDYRRWFSMMGQLGVQVLRIYTIHPPHMYEELKAYNEAHRSAPLYLVHGIYLPDESYIESHDLFSRASTEAMVAEVRDASAAVHGTLRRSEMRGRASGTWTADVSPWTAAWIVGVEWDPEAGSASDAKNADAPAHAGTYFSSHPEATPTERWIAARMDELAALEAAAGLSVPIAHANWPTADPLKHPQEPLANEDMLGVDANHVVPSDRWPGGTFASYHAYPYYPDFQMLQPSYVEAEDPYRAYLLDLARHHGSMPLMVSEFGVPSSLGSAHRGSLERDQGHHSEQDAMRMNAEMLRMFADAGLAGGLVFEWLDEWFKFTWNTVPRHAPVDGERRALWHDPFTNEQFFGLVAHDPKPVGRRVPYEGDGAVRSIAVDHDASWLHLDIDLAATPSSPVSVGFSILPEGGIRMPDGGGQARYDVAVTLDPGARQAACLIRGALDPVRLDGLPASAVPRPDANGWVLQRLTLNRPYTVPGTGQDRPAEFLEVGRLIEGDWSDPGNTLATWQLVAGDAGNAVFRLRLPWSMLGFADPSSRTVVVPTPAGAAPTGDAKLQDTPVGVVVEGIDMAVFVPGHDPVTAPIRWEGWQDATYTERLKAGVDVLSQALRDTAG